MQHKIKVMCRYAFKKYKPHFVCFDCRKSFKRPLLEDVLMQNGDYEAYHLAFWERDKSKSQQFREANPVLMVRFEAQYGRATYPCPDCGKDMQNIGLDFKAPPKQKLKEWERMRSLYSIGRTFHSCGCNGPGYFPQDQAAHLRYLKEIEAHYQSRLGNRSHEYQGKELAEYLQYWGDRLDAVHAEIGRIRKS